MNWETVIGLEIHAQLSTQSKIFSGSSTAYGAQQNRQANAVDLGLPGTLPVLNEHAVELAIRFGLAIKAEIASECIFDRKNYFYPDLPKGYQISQFAHPIVGRGEVEIALPDGTTRKVRITRAHLEEDAGKSTHDLFAGQSAIDLNRAGTPLLEIVSEPDLRNAEEAAAYFRTMHALVRYIGICDGNMNEGSLRCDANVSIRPIGSTELGQRTEIKNLNSFRFLERAINAEVRRQIDVLEGGGSIIMATMLYDAEQDETRMMRKKEDSDDYRYFPDPDLLPVRVDEAQIERIRQSLPELPEAKKERYINDLELSEYDASYLVSDPDIAALFEHTTAHCKDAKSTANWIMGELAAALNRDERSAQDNPVSATQLGDLILRINDDTLSSKLAKTVFEALWTADATTSVDEIIEQQGLKQVSDSGLLEQLATQVIADNPKQVEQFRAGKEKVLGFFVGQIMKQTQGKANPKQLNDLLRAKLKTDG